MAWYDTIGDWFTGANASAAPSSGGGSWWDALGKIVGLGTLGAGLYGAGSQYFGPRPEARTMTQPTAQQQASMAQAQVPLGQAQGLLQNPQIPPALAALVEQSFQPAMGDIATQAIQSARRRGFAGGADLLQTGPGGAIAGPALSNLQGQMAMAKLNLYNQWVQNLLGVSGSQRNLATAFQPTQVTQGPQPTLLQSIKDFGPILEGAAPLIWPNIFQNRKPSATMSGAP